MDWLMWVRRLFPDRRREKRPAVTETTDARIHEDLVLRSQTKRRLESVETELLRLEGEVYGVRANGRPRHT
jgi:hypothetical protein